MIVNEGGKKLPKLTTPGTSADLLTGKELIDQYGNVVEGGMPFWEVPTPYINNYLAASEGRLVAAVTLTPGYNKFKGSTSHTYQLSTKDDPNFVPENIARGKTIFGVAGTAPVAKKFYYESIPIETNETTIEIPMGPIDMLWASFYVDSSVSALLSSSTNGGTLIVRDDINFYWGHIIYTVNDRTAVRLDDLNKKYSTINNMTIIAIAGLSF